MFPFARATLLGTQPHCWKRLRYLILALVRFPEEKTAAPGSPVASVSGSSFFLELGPPPKKRAPPKKGRRAQARACRSEGSRVGSSGVQRWFRAPVGVGFLGLSKKTPTRTALTGLLQRSPFCQFETYYIFQQRETTIYKAMFRSTM